jgi:hypothetical protein
MVEIRYRDQFEVSELAGQTISEAREQFKAEFDIPNKAQAKLNGSKVKTGAEIDTVLTDDDKLTFVTARGKGAYLVGALLLALAITGGVFAAGFINASTTLNATTFSSNFADVSVNTTGVASLTWSAWGFYKGSIATSANGTPIFNIDTLTSGYTGDLVVTVSLGNADQLVKRYRALSLQLAMYDASGTMMDINESGAADSNDWVMLTLDNGSASMFPSGSANVTTVRVKKGFFITHVVPFGGWPSDSSASPDLFCEVAQR